jgi:peptidylprolyl isomerase
LSTNQQHREAERRRLQRQLEERRAREAARKRFTLIASIVTTLVVIAAVVVVVIVATSGGSDSGSGGTKAGGAATVSFQGVTVQHANDVKTEPKVSSKATTDPTSLQYKDLVVGSGKAAAPSDTVTVQYTGVLYKNGTQFDSSWSRGQPAQFSLSGVVAGFKDGIGGDGSIPPMKVGGRRLLILPASMGYGAQAQGSIPANSSLVFVVDLKSID